MAILIVTHYLHTCLFEKGKLINLIWHNILTGDWVKNYLTYTNKLLKQYHTFSIYLGSHLCGVKNETTDGSRTCQECVIMSQHPFDKEVSKIYLGRSWRLLVKRQASIWPVTETHVKITCINEERLKCGFCLHHLLTSWL